MENNLLKVNEKGVGFVVIGKGLDLSDWKAQGYRRRNEQKKCT